MPSAPTSAPTPREPEPCPPRQGSRRRPAFLGALATWLAIATLASGRPDPATEDAADWGLICDRASGPAAAIVAVRNTLDTPVTLTIDLKLENARADHRDGETLVIPAQSSGRLLTIRPRRPDKPWSHTFSGPWQLGSKDARHDARVRYRLPWRRGERHRVIQGYHGSSTHQGEHACALDFAMPEGTPVLAARAGTVVRVVDHFSESGRDEALKARGNVVVIAHRDGTVAQYGHLQRGGARVKRGQTVAAGDRIALSGNTGHSSRPHLHFEVWKPVDGRRVRSLRTRFELAPGRFGTPRSGRSYRAP